MSGGSYSYLCWADDLAELAQKESDLERMVERLAGLGYAQDAAMEAAELLVLLRQAKVLTRVRMRRLMGVFQSVEWWDSADSGEDDLKDALAEYRKELIPT